jgi:hypothetical protein
MDGGLNPLEFDPSYTLVKLAAVVVLLTAIGLVIAFGVRRQSSRDERESD